jgi:hypothetical protein
MKILDTIKKLFTSGKVYICEKCGWQTTENNTTDKIKCYCKNCDCQK